MQFPEKIALAALPTPIVRLDRLSNELEKGIWVKRDDMTGFEFSGNKVRKLEYVFHDVLKQGADVVITCGGIDSNHCRTTAAISAKLGVHCHVVLEGEEDGRFCANLTLCRKFGAEVTFVNGGSIHALDTAMNSEAEACRAKGLKPYLIPVGASVPLGVYGYIDAFKEISDFEAKQSVAFDVVASATGSGGTYAGLLAGNALTGAKKRVATFSVGGSEAYFLKTVARLLESFQAQLPTPVTTADMQIIDRYIGRGYALSSPEERAFADKIAKTEGFLIDPVYTGKAFYGFVTEIQKGAWPDADNFLFVHTGGGFSVFTELA